MVRFMAFKQFAIGDWKKESEIIMMLCVFIAIMVFHNWCKQKKNYKKTIFTVGIITVKTCIWKQIPIKCIQNFNGFSCIVFERLWLAFYAY